MKEIIKNNYKILIGIILGLILVLFLTGCKKDNLEPKPIINTLDSTYIQIKPKDTVNIISPSDSFIYYSILTFESTSSFFNIYVNNIYMGNSNYEGLVKTGDIISVRIYKNDIVDNDNITILLSARPIFWIDDWNHRLEINDTCIYNHLVK